MEEIEYSDCRSCEKFTRHEILHEYVSVTDDEINHLRDTWQIVRCLGCHNISFRRVHEDFEVLEEKSHGELTHLKSITIFPRFITNHKSLKATYFLPTLIRKIYTQTVNSLSEHSYVIASIGLRSCIEAVCNHLDIKGQNLEKRIDQLFKNGFVSNADKKRLHAIRFLGNDAAHDIKEPKHNEIHIALEIVEHLLNSVFILERRAKTLETIIETYDDFVVLLKANIIGTSKEKAFTLSNLLGKKTRLIGQKLIEFEDKLKIDIQDNKVDFLILGPIQKVNDKDTQFYEIIESKDENEIPV